MPRRPAQIRQLTPEQKRASDYLEEIILRWQLGDIKSRKGPSNKRLAAHVSRHYADPARSITPSGLGLWRAGKAIPDAASVSAIVQAFDADLEATFAAFGRVPPMTFARFAELVSQAAQRDQWDDAAWLLAQLAQTATPEWEEPDVRAPWWIQIARTLLKTETPLHEKAQQIAHLVEAHQHEQQPRLSEAQ